MQVINMQILRPRRLLESFLGLLRFDHFIELSGRSLTLLLQDKDGFRLARGITLNRPYGGLPIEASNLEDVCRLLRPKEDVALSLDEDQCFRRRVILPRASPAKIEAMLELDLARIAPFRSEDIMSGWIDRSTGQERSALEIEQIVIRKDVLTTIFNVIGAARAKLIAVAIHDEEEGHLPIAFAPDGKLYGANRFASWSKIAAASLAFLLLGLGAMGVSLNSWNDRNQTAIADAINGAQTAATEVQKRLDVIKVQSLVVSALFERKKRISGRSAAIEEISKLLPDDAYLDGLTIESTGIVADGSAVSPESLVSILEKSPFIEQVSLNAPVYRNPGDKTSRFSMKMTLETDQTESQP